MEGGLVILPGATSYVGPLSVITHIDNDIIVL